MILFRKNNVDDITIATNIDNDSLIAGTDSREFDPGSGRFVLFSDESYLFGSSRIFRKVVEISAVVFDVLHSNFIEQIQAHSHTLKKIQGQLTQRIEGVIGNPMYDVAQTYEEERKIVLEKVKNDPEAVTDGLIYLRKRIFELGAHMASSEILHLGEHLALDFKRHNLKKLLLNILYGFEDSFQELNITPYFMFEDNITDVNKIEADYKTLNAAFYNFFDNAIKYSKPYSQIRFYINFTNGKMKLIITMKSLRIEQDELGRVFELGYRSKNCRNEEGSGVGMYVILKALDLNKFDIEITPDYSQMERYNNQQYILNKFIISQR